MKVSSIVCQIIQLTLLKIFNISIIIFLVVDRLSMTTVNVNIDWTGAQLRESLCLVRLCVRLSVPLLTSWPEQSIFIFLGQRAIEQSEVREH